MITVHFPFTFPIPAPIDNLLIKMSYQIYLATDIAITPESIIYYAALVSMPCILFLLDVALSSDGVESDRV